MKRFLLCLIILLLAAGSAAGEAAPIWVDGTGIGNYITAPSGSVVDTITEGEPGIQPEPTATPDPNAPKKWEYTPTRLMAAYNGETVEVLSLGTRLSRIQAGDEKLTVRTAALVFSTTAKPGKQLAIIHTPKSGRASLFKRASSKAAIIYKCQTNRIVAVMDTGKRFAHLHYADADGYVRNTSLSYTEAWTGDILVATIAYRGNTRSKSTVKVRQKPSGSARILDEFRCGTQVVVLGQEGKWTEIEVDNLHAYILTEFLTEPTAWVEPSLLMAKEE